MLYVNSDFEGRLDSFGTLKGYTSAKPHFLKQPLMSQAASSEDEKSFLCGEEDEVCHKQRSGFWVDGIALQRRGELKVVPQLLLRIRAGRPSSNPSAKRYIHPSTIFQTSHPYHTKVDHTKNLTKNFSENFDHERRK
jgi:hypothetical protein